MFDDDQLIPFQLLESKDDGLSAHIEMKGKFLLYQAVPLLQLAREDHLLQSIVDISIKISSLQLLLKNFFYNFYRHHVFHKNPFPDFYPSTAPQGSVKGRINKKPASSFFALFQKPL